MICISIESKEVHGNEFNQSVDLEIVSNILRVEDQSHHQPETVNRLRGVFTTCRAIYNLDADQALTVCYNALLECVREGRCPTVTCIEDYRNAGNIL